MSVPHSLNPTQLMYTNYPQTAGVQAQGYAPQYEQNVTEAVSGPSLGFAHQQLDDALNRAYKTHAGLREIAERLLGGLPEMGSKSEAEPNVAGTLPGLIQKLGWLHIALGEIESQTARLSSL